MIGKRQRTWIAKTLFAAVLLGTLTTAPKIPAYAAEENLGWVQTSEGVSFYGETGKLTTGWKKLSGKWYCFDSKGLLQTGWAKDGSSWCFIGTNGVVQTKKWKQWKSNWYYLNPNGTMATGWKKLSGKWYAFRKDGSMAAEEYIDGYWMKKDGTWDGRDGKAVWRRDKNGWYFIDQSGWYPKSRWLWIDQVCYYFNNKGYLVTNTTVDGAKVNKDGAWVKNDKVVMHAGATKTAVSAQEITAIDTSFTYMVTPLLEPFNDFFFIQTDNPDPDSFSFVDHDTVYSESDGSIAPVSSKYEDVKYVNASTLRVKGGFIASGSYTDGGELCLVQRRVTGTTPVYNITTGETTYRKNYVTEETDTKIKVAKVMDDVDYLIDTYAKGKTAFFDKMDAVQTGLGSICLYSGVYVLGDLYKSEAYPYYGISSSPHVDQRYYIQEPYGRRDNKSMFISALYPYRLDSVGFPGELSAVAKRLDSGVTTASNSSSHWLVDITYQGTTKSYGGQGNGGGQGINQDQILYTFLFDGSGKDAATKINMTDLPKRIREYGALTVDTDAGKTIPRLTWATIRKTVGEGSYVRIQLITSIFGGSATGYTYLYDNGATTEGASYMGNVGYMYNTWFEGRYYNKYEYYYPGATLADTVENVQPSLTFRNVSIRLPEDGKQYYCYRSKMEDGSNVTKERTVEEYGYDAATGCWPGYTTFTYDAESLCWKASQFVPENYYSIYFKENGKKVYLSTEDLLDQITITMDEAEAMGIDANTNVAPGSFLIYDRKSEPGTPGTSESE